VWISRKRLLLLLLLFGMMLKVMPVLQRMAGGRSPRCRNCRRMKSSIKQMPRPTLAFSALQLASFPLYRRFVGRCVQVSELPTAPFLQTFSRLTRLILSAGQLVLNFCTAGSAVLD